MSWDIVLFHSRQRITSPGMVDELLLDPINIDDLLAAHFPTIEKDDRHRRIKGLNFDIEYFTSDQLESNKLMQLYGQDAIYSLVVFAKKYQLQLFDTALGEMIDLANPSANGYNNFQAYLQQIFKA